MTKRILLSITMYILSTHAARAGTLYTINFGGGPPAPAGSFTYDPGTGFSNFTVAWNGYTFDLTAAANAPLLFGTGCTGEVSTPAYGFEIMNQSVAGCPTPPVYTWQGLLEATDVQFSLMLQSGSPLTELDKITELILIPVNSNPVADALGPYTITAETSGSAPEPATVLVRGCGLALLAGIAARRARR